MDVWTDESEKRDHNFHCGYKFKRLGVSLKSNKSRTAIEQLWLLAKRAAPLYRWTRRLEMMMKENYYIHDIGWSDCGIKSVDAFGVAVRFCLDL